MGGAGREKSERYHKIRLEMGAQPDDPFLVSWDLDTWSLSSEGLVTSH